jgi:c-di-GMP-binding flagellar brake protein YcgR
LTFYKPQNTLPFPDTVTVWGGVPAHVNGRNVNNQKHQHLRIDRKHFRIATDLPCKVGPSDGKVTTARVLDLSIGGLKFSCDRATIKQIIPENQQALGLILGVEIVIHFTIKQQDKRASAIKTPARIIHSERLAQDLFHVGIRFLGLEPTTAGKLETYIGELMAAARAAPETSET